MGNEFKIKNDVKLKIVDEQYLQIEYSKCFAKKIYSRNFPSLIGKNEYNSEGREALGILNLLEKADEIDPFYMLRGEVAERFVADVVKVFFEKKYGNGNVEVIVFANTQFTYGDQWNYDKETGKGNKEFGGRMDIGIKVKTADGKVLAFIIEVKSKSMKDHEKIAVKKQYPESETYQGIFLANMGNQSQVTMFWVFFTEKQEEELRSKLDEWLKDKSKLPELSFGFKDVKYHSDLIKFDRKEIWQDMLVARKNIERMAKEKRIPLFMFKDKDMNIIQQHIIECERIEALEKESRNQFEKDVEKAVEIGVSMEDLPF